MYMRRKDREVTDPGQIWGIWQECRVCRLAMADGPRPYVVPMNFGIERQGDRFTVYLHSAKEGRKLKILQSRPAVCLEADCGYEPLAAETACGYGCTFASVIAEGRAEILEDPQEKAHGLSVLMRHQTGQEFTFTQAQAESVAVIRVEISAQTAKRRARP